MRVFIAMKQLDVTQILVRPNITAILFSSGINKHDMGKEKKNLQFHLKLLSLSKI